jgi:hypothetical protein
VGNATGRLFTGLHGDGMLTSGGEADFTALKWPDATANGAGYRGGNYDSPSALARVSERSHAAYVKADRSHADLYGWRAVRSAPPALE